MATQGKGATPKRKASVPTGDFSFPPVSLDTPRPLKQDWEIVMGYIAALILAVLIIPILGMLYMDVLQTKKEAKTQIEKMEKLRRDIEKQRKEKNGE
jgi:cbb3-type cytochrome oxidase subunit 3